MALLLCGVSLLGCTDGYPTNDAVRVDAMSAVEHVRSLNRYLGDSPTRPASRLSVVDACTLSGSTATTRTRVELRTIVVTFDTEPTSGEYLVNVEQRIAGRAVRSSFAVNDWVAATAFRSHLQQLQRLCLEAGGASVE